MVQQASPAVQVLFGLFLMAASDDVVLRECRVSALLAKTPNSDGRPDYEQQVDRSEGELILHPFSLIFRHDEGDACVEILLENLIGVNVLQQRKEHSSECVLLVSDYHLENGNHTNAEAGSARVLRSTELGFAEEESFEKNKLKSLEWKKAIMTECSTAVKKLFINTEGDRKKVNYLPFRHEPSAKHCLVTSSQLHVHAYNSVANLI